MSELSYLGYKQRCEEQQKALDEMKEALKMVVGQRNKANQLVKKLKKKVKQKVILTIDIESQLMNINDFGISIYKKD